MFASKKMWWTSGSFVVDRILWFREAVVVNFLRLFVVMCML